MDSPHDPRARDENVVYFGHARFTFLTECMVRLEWAEDKRFEDRPTFAAANRRTPPVRFTREEKGTALTLHTARLTLRYRETGRPFNRRNLSAVFKLNGKTVEWRYGQKDRGNLLGTCKTLDGVDGGMVDKWVPYRERDPAKPVLRQSGNDEVRVYQGDKVPLPLGSGLLSRDGWTFVDDAKNVVLDAEACDWQPWPVERPEGVRRDGYLLAHGRDYKAALRDASLVFGAQPLPPRFALGYWYSRYWAYTDKEIEALVRQFDRYQVPLDVMVIDMDWHKLGWTGYTWDEDFFPDPREFLAWLRARDLKISLNLHPGDGVFSYEKSFPYVCAAMGIDPKKLPRIEPVYDRLYELLGLDPGKAKRIPLDVCDPAYMRAYFEFLHHPLEDEGVDFWWMDWQQGRQGSKLPNLDTLPWINELHWRDQRRRAPEKRALNFSRFGGIGAGRMPVGFSGDTIVTWDSLAFQPYFTATASNVLYGYWSHDIGGHMGGIQSPELYTRWIQYGLYSPVLRTHTSKDARSERRVFEYPDPYKSVMISALHRRYALIPYIHTELRHTWESGVSLCRPMYYEHPEEDAAYRARDQYFFGAHMLVAPVLSPLDPSDEMADVKVWLPDGRWFDTCTGECLKGGSTLHRRYTLGEIPVFVRPGTVWAEQSPPLRVRGGSYADLRFIVYPGNAGEYTLFEDDGTTLGYRHGGEARITLRHEGDGGVRKVILERARGGFAGFQPVRPVEIHLAATVPPESILLGRNRLPWSHRGQPAGWHYNGDAATTVIRIADADLRKGFTLTVRERAGVSPVAAFGLKGLMHRLERVRYYNCLVSPPRPIIGEERLAVRIAQTGNRIQRNPDRFRAELTAMKRDLRKLPAVLREYQEGYRKRQDNPNAKIADKIAELQRARDILATTLRSSGDPAAKGRRRKR